MDLTNTKVLQELITIAVKTPSYQKNEFIRNLKLVDKSLRQHKFPYPEIIIRRCLAYCFRYEGVSSDSLVKIVNTIIKEDCYIDLDIKTFKKIEYTFKNLPVTIHEKGLTAFFKLTDPKQIKEIRQFISSASRLNHNIDQVEGDNLFFEHLDSLLMVRMLPA